MPESSAKAKYDIEYAKTKLKRVPLDVKKEKYEEIKAAATAAGESVNGYIKNAVDSTDSEALPKLFAEIQTAICIPTTPTTSPGA